AIQEGCNMVVTVGFLLGDATDAAAQANPDTDFAIVDYAYEAPSPNLKGMVFATEQSSFLAGYLAAGMSKTGIVATYGGIPIPPVTAFMTGFYQGVQYYNNDVGTNVNAVDEDGKTFGFITGRGKPPKNYPEFKIEGLEVPMEHYNKKEGA
ncbi:MAG: BMP family ABC transporter substrate-binding protein, partial [Candidatus Nanopelagicales bacterium]